MLNFSKNNYFFEKVKKIIPLASQTFSKSHLQYIENFAPLFIEKGKGAFVWDIDGNQFIDLESALLPIILGYRDEAVDDAIKKQLKEGVIFSLSSPLEYQLANKLIQLIPCAEMVRFGKNGSDATAGAVRLARAITKKDRIAVCGYHGWQDWYIGVNPRNQGVPETAKNLVHKFIYNDIASLEELFKKHQNEFAAVIMEPMNSEYPKNNFLEKVKKLAHKNNALLIFDEIITGFRFDLGGAQKKFGVIPDLATFGKAMANGMPISAIVGKAEYMQKMEDIFYSFTFGGECLSIIASLATIKKLEDKKVLNKIWRRGEYLQTEFNKLIEKNGLESVIELKGAVCWQIFNIRPYNGYSDMEIKSFIQQELIKRRILWTGSHNLNFSHNLKIINYIIEAYGEILPILKNVLKNKNLKEKLLGKPIQGNYNVRKL